MKLSGVYLIEFEDGIKVGMSIDFDERFKNYINDNNSREFIRNVEIECALIYLWHYRHEKFNNDKPISSVYLNKPIIKFSFNNKGLLSKEKVVRFEDNSLLSSDKESLKIVKREDKRGWL